MAGGKHASLAALLVFASCGTKQPAPQRAELEGTAVAKVDDDVIVADTVARIAAAQRIDTKQALERATFDALVAREARAKGYENRTKKQLDAALARLLVEDLAEESRREGPPTDEEVEALTAAKWVDVARPDAVVVVHAVVLVPEDADSATTARALAVAEKIAAAVAPAAPKLSGTVPPDYLRTRRIEEPAAQEFLQLARGVDAGGLSVVVELLPPVGSDGATISMDQPRGPLDPLFVAGALPLHRGEISKPVRSSFGFHVIMGLDRIRGENLSLEERRTFFTRSVMYNRTQKRIDALVARLRAETEVADKDPSLDELLMTVKVAP